MKMSTTEAASAPSTVAAGTPPASAYVDPSPRKTRSKSTESEGMLIMSFPVDGPAYLNLSFVKDENEALLLLPDRKRLTKIGPVQSVECSLAHLYQVNKKFCLFFISWNLSKC